MLAGHDEIIADATGLPVRVVGEPLVCVVRGTSVYLADITEWRKTMETDKGNE